MTRLVTLGCIGLSASVLLAGCSKAPVMEAPITRPLKTMVIDADASAVNRSVPGRVLAGRRVQLAFDVSGTVIELNAREGQFVETGTVIAKLDQRDFINAVESARAERDRSKARYQRIRVAAELNAVSQQELSDALATLEMAEAQMKIREKALEDSVLTARFAGHIATRHVDNFTAIQPKQPIVSLQDISTVEIEAFLPEADLIGIDPSMFGKQLAVAELSASFETLPGVQFPVTLKELATEADSLTRTFRVVVTMNAPTNNIVLPGMTATIQRNMKASEATPGVHLVPLNAVSVDAVTGEHYIWLVTSNGAGSKVTRRTVKTGEIIGRNLVVLSGLNKGDRIALAGVSLLQEGASVKPVE